MKKENTELVQRFNYEPKSLEEAMKMAEMLSNCDLVPKDYKGKPGNILAAMQYGRELGVPCLQALQGIAVIGGRACVYGDLALAVVRVSPPFERISESWDAKTEEATCTIKRRGEEPITRTFSMADARRISVYADGKKVILAEKDMYKNYGKRMCQMRARAFAMRDGFADVLKGMAIREEIEDVEPSKPEIVQPERLPETKQQSLPAPEPQKTEPTKPETFVGRGELGLTSPLKEGGEGEELLKETLNLENVALKQWTKKDGKVSHYSVITPTGLVLETKDGVLISTIRQAKTDKKTMTLLYWFGKDKKTHELQGIESV